MTSRSLKPAAITRSGSYGEVSDDDPYDGATDSGEESVRAEDDDNGQYRCVCKTEEGPDITQAVCCDGCEYWQHVTCMAQTEEDIAPEKEYYCHICRPEAHHDICVGLERGEISPRHRANVIRELMKMFAALDWLRSYWDDMLETGHEGVLEQSHDALSRKHHPVDAKKEQLVQKVGGKGTGKMGKQGRHSKTGNKKKAGRKVEKPTAYQKGSKDESDVTAHDKLDIALARAAAGGLRMRERVNYAETSSRKSKYEAPDTESEFEAESDAADSTETTSDAETEPTPILAPRVFQPFSAAGVKAGLQTLFDRCHYNVLFGLKENYPKAMSEAREDRLERLVDYLRGEATYCWNGEQRKEVLAMGTFAEVLRICPKGHHKLAEDPVAFQEWYDAQTGVTYTHSAKSASGKDR